MSKLNWRLILAHLIGCWLFIYAYMMFSYLHDNTFIATLMSRPKSLANQTIDSGRLSIDMLWINLSKPAGLLTAIFISVIIVIRRHWHWLNSLIVLVMAFLLLRYDLFGWDYLKFVLTTPGRLFEKYSIGYFLTNGLIMITIGLVLFVSKWSAQFINSAMFVTKQRETRS